MYTPIRVWTKRDRKISREGYLLIKVPEHPKAFKGFYYEHRLIIEKQINRVLNEWETIHHINEDKIDNRLINLFLCSRLEHNKAHCA
jgi:HNH endonuclease